MTHHFHFVLDSLKSCSTGDLTNRPRFSIIHMFTGHTNDVVNRTEIVEPKVKQVISLQSLKHVMASFLWFQRVYTIENCGRLAFSFVTTLTFAGGFIAKKVIFRVQMVSAITLKVTFLLKPSSVEMSPPNTPINIHCCVSSLKFSKSLIDNLSIQNNA